MKTKKRERVKIEDLGLYIRTIQIDHKIEDNQELADLVTQYFNVLCLEEDIEYYMELHYQHEEFRTILNEDFETSSRRHQYFQELRTYNPFE
jgi:hypothetical protein